MADDSDRAERGERGTDDTGKLPEGVIERAERLTRRAREAVDDNEATAYRRERDDLLGAHGYRARVREEDHDVLALYPDDWVEDGTVYPDRIDDLDRGIERPLEGPGDTGRWAETERHNRALAETVAAEHGPVHGANAHALADFMSNHYAKPIERATGAELAEFRTEYFPRNAWPTDDQKAVVDESIRLVFACTERSVPGRD